MADNYIENRMEQHRRGAYLPAARRTRQGFAVTYPLPQRRIFAGGGMNDVFRLLVESLMKEGMKVAYSPLNDSDVAEVLNLREQTGVMILPAAPEIASLAYSWRGLDILLFSSEEAFESLRPEILDASRNPLNGISDEIPVIIIDAAGESVIIQTTVLPETGEIPSGGEITVNGKVAVNAVVRHIRWLMSPENAFLTGSRYAFMKTV